MPDTPTQRSGRSSEDALIRALVAVGAGVCQHIYTGGCPDAEDPDDRDPDCDACRVLAAAGEALNSEPPIVVHQWRAIGIDRDERQGVGVEVGPWTDLVSAVQDLQLVRADEHGHEDSYLEHRTATYSNPERITTEAA